MVISPPRVRGARSPRCLGARVGALEIECDGKSVTLRVDGDVVDDNLPPANLSAIVLHAGHAGDAATAEPGAAYWSTVFAARKAPASSPSKVVIGAETSEAWAGAGATWTKVMTSGTAPTQSRGAAAAQLSTVALYVWGGLPRGQPRLVQRRRAVRCSLNLASNPPAWSRNRSRGGVITRETC